MTNDFEPRWHFNTSIVAADGTGERAAREPKPLDVDMKPVILKRVLDVMVLMLSPMAPHIAEELWEMLGNQGGLSKAKWPVYREDLTREEQIEMIIQINGRLRGKMLVEEDLGEDETRERAMTDPRIAPLLAGKQMVKVVVVPKKLVNIVLR